MKKLYLLSAIIFLWGCNMAQKKSEEPSSSSLDTTQVKKEIAVPEGLSEIDGYRRHIISLPPKPNESRFKLEITPGVTMEVDACNHYGLQGSLEQEINEESGEYYYIFRSGGDVFQTNMGCRDENMHTEFVSGMNFLADYNSSEPLVVYISKGVEIKQTIWEVSEMIAVPKNPDNEILKTFPKSYYKDNLEGYVIQLPDLPPEARVELIPGITQPVDCNNYWLTNKSFGYEGTIEFPWTFYLFEFDGKISSTHMQCPDGQLSEKFIHCISPITLPAKNDEPIVLFITKGLELRYRIWNNPEVIG